MNDGSEPGQDEESSGPKTKLDRKTLFIAIGLLGMLTLLVALNMN